MKKRVLSLLLSILLVLSLAPVSALAEGNDPGEPDPAPMSDPAADPAPEVDGVENDLTDPAPQDEEDVLMGDPQPTSDGEDITPDPDEMNEEDNTQEVPLPAVNEGNAPSDDLTPATEPVQVVFTCDPTDLVLTVWAKPETDEEPAPILPEEDGAYLLLPGEYLYTAEAEGYAPAEEVPFTVAASEELLQIDIVLITEQIEIDSADALNDPEDEPECIGPAIVLDNSEDETDSEDSQTGSDETEGKFVSDALESDQSDLDGEPQILSASKNEMLADAELEYCYMDREESNADLFAKYVDRMFRNLGKEQTRHMPTPDARLSEAGFAVEQALKSMIMEVAEGTRTDTYFEVDLAELGYDPSSITQDDIDVLPSILIFDCSYELYWFGCAWTIPMIYSGNLYFGFVVGMPFRPEESEEFSVDTAAITRANTAVANAQAIIDRYAACSDYDKLHGYKNEICKLNVYNYDAANASNDDPWYACETDNNPWALVNVFDNDPETNVVCEGYSEAFEYLCNQSVFRSSLTNAYCVTGINHKWNNVTMDDGKNYMVDVTWCDDENSVNGNDDWFLRPWCGADGVAPSFDSFHIKINTSYGGWYLSERSYDDETKASYSDAALTLSDTEYVPGAYVSVTGVTVTPTTASVAVGGTQQLTATVEPSNAMNPAVTWTSSDDSIATVVDGVVTGVAKGEVTITATTVDGGYTATCAVTVIEIAPSELPLFHGHALLLTGQIGLQFLMDLPGGAGAWQGSYMTFEGNNMDSSVHYGEPKLIPFSETDKRWAYTIELSSIQMADKFTPTFHYFVDGNEEEITITDVAYSAEDYIIWGIDPDNTSGDMLAIIRSLADYGYYSQPYLSAQNRWTVGVDYAQFTTRYTESFNYSEVLTALTPYAVETDITGFTYRVNFGSFTSLDIAFKLAEGEEVLLDGTTPVTTAGDNGYTIVTIDEITAKQLTKTHVLKVGEKTVDNISAMTYAYKMLSKSDSTSDCKNLMCAFYNYGAACGMFDG